MAATDQQVQSFCDQSVRPRVEQIRQLYLACKLDVAQYGDIYANLTNNPEWTDARTDGPPHLAVPSDMLAVNSFVAAFINLIEGGDTSQGAAQWPIVQKLCVRG